MAQWTANLESYVITIVKTKFSDKLKKKYPNIFFTTEEKNTSSPKFPTVYIHNISGIEEGRTTELKDFNAVNLTIQAEVTTNKDSLSAKEVINEVQEIIHDIGFTIMGIPITTQDGNLYRSVIRARRRIGDGDTL